MEPTKSILVVAPRNVARAGDFLWGMGIKVFTRSRYLGVFIEDREADEIWLTEKVQGWKESVKILLGVARKHPQSAYAGLQKSLQQEWAFVQQVTPDIGDSFVPVEQGLRDAFITALLQVLGEGTPGRGFTHLDVK